MNASQASGPLFAKTHMAEGVYPLRGQDEEGKNARWSDVFPSF